MMDHGSAPLLFPHSVAIVQRLDASRSRLLSSKSRSAADRVIFRARAPADTPDLFDLFNEQSFLDNASTHGRFLSHADFEHWLDGIAACSKYEIVAQAGQDVVAFGALYPFTDQMSHCGSLILGVRQAWHRKAIGATILQLLLVSAEIMVGLSKIVLTVFQHNAGAIRLYQSFGFEIEGLHRRFSRHGDGFHDAYSMALFFDPPH